MHTRRRFEATHGGFSAFSSLVLCLSFCLSLFLSLFISISSSLFSSLLSSVVLFSLLFSLLSFSLSNSDNDHSSFLFLYFHWIFMVGFELFVPCICLLLYMVSKPLCSLLVAYGSFVLLFVGSFGHVGGSPSSIDCSDAC